MIHLPVLGFLILTIQSELIEGGPLINLVVETTHVASLVFVRVDFYDSKVVPQSLS